MFELFFMIKRFFIVMMLFVAAFLPSYAGEPTGAPEDEKGEAAILFPNIIGGLKKGEVSTYTGDKLYLLIDGEAETFNVYGYRKLQAAPYSGKDGLIQVQVSDMGNNLAAFGIFSFYTNRHGKFVKMGSEGFLEDHSLYFYKDRFFVQVQHLQGEKATELLENVSREICAVLPGKPIAPVEAGYFPRENLIRYTVRYIPKSFMGYSFLPPAFEAYYRDGEEGRFRVFFFAAGNEEKAGKCMKMMREKVKNVLLKREGKWVAGAVDFKNREKAEEIIERVLRGIAERG